MTDDQTDIRRLMVALHQIDGIYYFIAKKAGTKGKMILLLYALNDGLPHSQKEICDQWLIPKTTINTVVKECIQKGYVKISALEQKEKKLELTTSGKQYTQTILASLFEIEHQALAKTKQNYSAEFIDALVCFSNSMIEQFMALIGDESHE
ncbi:MAG: MarR family transcriptional regulator [Erysipelotrichaceae bacterium]|nr:MarR family transcriptional regulator [Erysipelotrichaceae bacterium]